ncbi:MAG: alpha/beta hydrolase [Flammeovirgaceae bacterium]|nr:alpha/beta hydrolase [Flammeovirgaceae bacterium]|tara:strand:+ start:2998 stop:3735 length:738 start_codon:yes stop_codon:yes gene_type:complete
MNITKPHIDKGSGEIIILLHGLFGALSNWKSVVDSFSKKYRVIIPRIPLTEVNVKDANLESLTKSVSNFIEKFKLKNFTLIGNSLGGHIGLIYTIQNPSKVKRLVLTGSSGLYENSFGGSFPKRGDYNYINERINHTFYNPDILTKKYVDNIFETLNNNEKCLNIINIARSAQRNNLAKKLYKIKCPTFLIWGLNDTITPPSVAHQFNKMIPKSKLKFIDRCCHAPMMERPKIFNSILKSFLDEN